ncbi:Flagellar biosynthesis protein FlhF [bioreactor metagenome]|uniref:Flagellar biosynthesis protein FlhF n=1 Tax=bioreactor metagenome TaxID=1076179 RepID=A0A645GF42_9ZZZZ
MLKDVVNDISENVKYKYTGTMPPNLAQVFKILRNSDISEELALEIAGKIMLKGVANDFTQALNEAKRLLLTKLSFTNPIAKIDSKQIVSFLGPTGSGKTTTLIKLAIVCKLLHKFRILIVSTDTYKVGGSEQLQTLASISGIAFTVAYTPAELRKIVNEETKYDMIMIDTVGRNPNNLDELNSI